MSFCLSDKLIRMAGLDFPSLPHLHVSDSKDHKCFTMNQAPLQTTSRDRRSAWNRRAHKNLIENPKRTNFHLSPTPTGTKTVTFKKSITDRQCAQKQRPLSGPESGPQNGWTHSGSLRVAGLIGDPKMSYDFGTVPRFFWFYKKGISK